MRIRILVFLAAVLIFVPATFSTENCSFEPNPSAGRVVAMRNIFNTLRLFADTSQSHSAPQVPVANVRQFPAVDGVVSDEDVVCLKLLIHPTGVALDARVQKNGRIPASKCLGYQWAAATKFVPGTLDDENVSAWLTTDIHIVYGPDSVRVWAESDIAGATLQAADDADLPDIDEFVPVDKIAELIESVEPDYPPAEKQAGHTGVVWLKSLVDRSGAVRKTVVFKTSGYPALDSAAIDIAPQNRFKPAEINGQPTTMWVTYKVDFE